MNSFSVDPRRYRVLNSRQNMGTARGPVLYWMSRDRRIQDNWSLLHAAEWALMNKTTLDVVYCLNTDAFSPNPRATEFMMYGLQETAENAFEKGLGFTVLAGENQCRNLILFARRHKAAAVICDFNPLREAQQNVSIVSEELEAAGIPLIEVDAHNVVPCRYISEKQEFGAHTLRKKIEKVLPDFLTDYPDISLIVKEYGLSGEREIADRYRSETETLLHKCGSFTDAAPEAASTNPGSRAAEENLELFLDEKLGDYENNRNNPLLEATSGLSPYLHFGQIAAQKVSLEAAIRLFGTPLKGGFLDELIVRKELSDNFCLHNTNYDKAEGFPEWAGRTLELHRNDRREYIYSKEEFILAETHDPLWNAAQKSLCSIGRLHGYMRMYWAKKILEWTPNPETAMVIAVDLNDRFALDGGDPNGYAGCAWAVGGAHDRAWQERPVYGKIRYMNDNGCRRKFKVDDYITKMNKLPRPQDADGCPD